MAIKVENGIISGITGYDIHFAHDLSVEYSEERKGHLTRLKEFVVTQIETAIGDVGLCYIRDVDQYDKPAGPWPGPMFEIEIGTVAKEAADDNAAQSDLVQRVDTVMRRVVAKTKEVIEQEEIKGTLIVHPNKGSKNTDYAFERKGLYELSWKVTGPDVPFIDIWDAPQGLSHARRKVDEMRASGSHEASIKDVLRTWTLPNGSKYSERLINKLLKEPNG